MMPSCGVVDKRILLFGVSFFDSGILSKFNVRLTTWEKTVIVKEFTLLKSIIYNKEVFAWMR
ncbi:MAG: hypothetical protein GX250_02230 [Clostridiales bacterium]|nr:hypothetical protein [Clostridiales bacterium]